MPQSTMFLASSESDTGYTLAVIRKPDGKEYCFCIANDGKLTLTNVADGGDVLTYTPDA